MTHFTKQSELAQPLNDDDLYVIDIHTRSVVEHHGSKTVAAIAMRSGAKWAVHPGQALVTGLGAKSLIAPLSKERMVGDRRESA